MMIEHRPTVLMTIAMFFAAACGPASAGEEQTPRKSKVQVACIGDSITQGARVEDKAKDAYPAQLQALLGDGYEVMNLGVGSCTLIRKGSPNVWRTLKSIQAKNLNPDIVIVSLGTNDTCGGSRKCWDHKDDFPTCGLCLCLGNDLFSESRRRPALTSGL